MEKPDKNVKKRKIGSGFECPNPFLTRVITYVCSPDRNNNQLRKKIKENKKRIDGRQIKTKKEGSIERIKRRSVDEDITDEGLAFYLQSVPGNETQRRPK